MEGEKEDIALDFHGIDDVIRHVTANGRGRFQKLTFLLLACNYFPVVFHHVSMAFYGYSPPYECRPQRVSSPGASSVASQLSDGVYNGYDVNETGLAVTRRERVIFRRCDAVVMSEAEKEVNLTEQCVPGEFRYALPDKERTVVMEWDLVCDRAYFAHLATTVYYCGVMLGGFVCGFLSDHIGRRPVMLATLFGATILGTGLAFIRDFPAFLAMRFVLGFLAQGLHTSTFIMAIELFPVRQRTMAGCLIQLAWGAAVLALGGLAWLLKDWRHIQLALSLPSLLAVSYFWLAPESLRWLLARGKCTEAERLIKRITSFNGLDSPLRTQPQLATRALLLRHDGGPDNNHNDSKGEDSEKVASAETGWKEEKKKRAQGSVKDLFSSTVMLKRSMILFYIWFAGNVCYFGLTFLSTSLAGNRFLNYTLSASVEFLAYALNLVVLHRFGRRTPLCVYFCIATVSCLGVGLIPPITESGVDLRKLITAFSVMGKFAAGGSFTSFELLTVEMYPTVLRNVGAGLCGFWGRLGAVVAPQFLSLGLYTFSQLPAILIGILTLLGGVLTLLLPDTSHSSLPDTVFEVTVEAEQSEQVKEKAGGDAEDSEDPLLVNSEKLNSV